MATEEFDVREFSPATASPEDFASLHAFATEMKAEALPQEPPDSPDQLIRNLRSVPSFVRVVDWNVFAAPSGEVVAIASVSFARTPENQHAANFWIGVLPRLRRRGLAKSLLRPVADATETEGRRLLVTNTSSLVPAGEAFMHRIGAELGLASYVNELRLEDVDPDLIADWLEAGSRLVGEFELGFWDGAYPEADFDAICRLQAVMNTAPRDALDMEDSAPDPQRLRQRLEVLAKRQTQLWTMYARHRASGDLVGYTETYWNAGQPHLLDQGDTGVFPEYRTRGIGRWLKAAMLDKVLTERPQVRIIHTNNAQSNAPMLRINEQLGFRPHHANLVWQVATKAVRRYLDGR